MTDSQKWLTLAFTLFISLLIYLLAPILLPFAIAAALAYLGDPLVDRLEVIKIKHWQFGRTFAVSLVFVTFLILFSTILIIIIPGIESQITLFVHKLPTYIRWINKELLPLVNDRFQLSIAPFDSQHLISIIKSHWQQAGGIFSTVIGSVSKSGSVIMQLIMDMVLIPVISFYLLRDWDILVAKIHDLFPRRISPLISKLASESDQVLGAFIRGQFYVMIALGIIYSFGLWLVGLELALLIGMLAGLVSFVPYLGSIVGIVAACLAAILQFQDVMYLLPVALVFIIGQSIEGMLLTPWLVGDRIGLHPVAVIFAVLAGGQLFGFLGVLLALPTASVIMVILRHIHELYTGSQFYSEHQPHNSD